MRLSEDLFTMVITSLLEGSVMSGFLEAAQIDMYGNINTTVIGTDEKSKVRLLESSGANDVGSLCWKTIVLVHQDGRKFVEKIDLLTTPDYLTGPGAREEAGLLASTGPCRVIAQLGLMGFDDKSRRMTLFSTYPGVDLQQITANTDLRLIVPEMLIVMDPPTPRELSILRSEIDLHIRLLIFERNPVDSRSNDFDAS